MPIESGISFIFLYVFALSLPQESNTASQNSRQAIKILDSQERNFEYDGEMSIDTAINSEAL